MIHVPSYPAARAIASRAEQHFARHLSAARSARQQEFAPLPDAASIEAIIDAAFWASLRREEGTSPKISLAFVPPEAAGPAAHVRAAAPAVARRRWPSSRRRSSAPASIWASGVTAQASCVVWGTTRQLPAMSFVLEVVASGLLVIKHRSEAFGKFVNVAVLEGDQVKIVDEHAQRVPDCPGVVASLLGVEVPGVAPDTANVLVQIAASMRAHGRGGALLVVPSGTDAWSESILSPVLYAVAPMFSELSSLVAGDERDRASARMAGGSAPSRRRDGGTDRRRRRHDHQRALRAVRVRREDHAAPRQRPGRAHRAPPSRSRAARWLC